MQVSLENVGALERRLVIKFPAADLDGRVRERMQEIGRNAQIKGFRPGRVPAKVIEQRFGAQVRGEALGEIVGRTPQPRRVDILDIDDQSAHRDHMRIAERQAPIVGRCRDQINVDVGAFVADAFDERPGQGQGAIGDICDDLVECRHPRAFLHPMESQIPRQIHVRGSR